MRIWLIKVLYYSLSPSAQLMCHYKLKVPSINAAMTDVCNRMDKNWLKSASYKASKSKDEKPHV